MTLETADGICGRLDRALEWPYIVLPIMELGQFNGWRVDVVNVETLRRLTLVDVYGKLVQHAVPERKGK